MPCAAGMTRMRGPNEKWAPNWGPLGWPAVTDQKSGLPAHLRCGAGRTGVAAPSYGVNPIGSNLLASRSAGLGVARLRCDWSAAIAARHRSAVRANAGRRASLGTAAAGDRAGAPRTVAPGIAAARIVGRRRRSGRRAAVAARHRSAIRADAGRRAGCRHGAATRWRAPGTVAPRIAAARVVGRRHRRARRAAVAARHCCAVRTVAGGRTGRSHGTAARRRAPRTIAKRIAAGRVVRRGGRGRRRGAAIRA